MTKKVEHVKQDDSSVTVKYKFKNFDICEPIHFY
jgi:hypothetical protein